MYSMCFSRHSSLSNVIFTKNHIKNIIKKVYQLVIRLERKGVTNELSKKDKIVQFVNYYAIA